MEPLASKKCIPCQVGEPPLPPEKVQEYLKQLPEGWHLTSEGFLEKQMKFKDFKEALAVINRVGEVAEAEGHHPDIHLEQWNNVRFVLFTHAIKGLHENDFIFAAKIERVIAS
ncbi:4a-hydroxytetrahydrobiopterin dehydratase [Candidatus Azambacteria bacterium]|nr:4a-hydroxytetrahydrobiopterin dehydratase [Candidatus Azambacteria bacterium]